MKESGEIEYRTDIHAYKLGVGELANFPISVPSPPEADNQFITPEALVDIDGDGFVDIVAEQFLIVGPLSSKLYAWNKDGQPISGFPIFLTGGDLGSAQIKMVVGDFGNDGDVDLIVPSFGGGLYSFDFTADFHPKAMEWPMYRHDAQHTGRYGEVEEPPINTPPVMTDIPNMQVSEPGLTVISTGYIAPVPSILEFEVTATDAEGQEMALSFEGFPAGDLRVSPSTPTADGMWDVKFRPAVDPDTEDDVYTVTATVTDSEGASDSDDFLLTVLDRTVGLSTPRR